MEASQKSEFGKVFYLLFATNLLINLDHGIIPADSITIEESLDLTNDQLGLLGSMVYAGIVFVGLFAGSMFLRIEAKKIILASLMGMMTSLVLFTFHYQSALPFYILRFLTGAFQAPLLIYFPVWVDNYGGDQKTLWLTLLQGGVPFGVFTGYVMSSLISQRQSWQLCFYLQVTILVPCLLGFIVIKGVDLELNSNKKAQGTEDFSEDYANQSYFSLIKILYSSKIYTFIMFALGVLYFTVTGIQFWITNYMETILHQPQKLVNTVFSFVSITAPTFGCILGGNLTQYLGGYEGQYAIPFCLACSIMGCISAIPVPFVDDFWLISGCIWNLLFFGGAMVPGLTGIMITSIKPGLRSFANSNTTMFINLFGYLPAPSVYGQLSNINPRGGITFLMLYPLTTILFIGAALVIKSMNLSQVQKDDLPISIELQNQTQQLEDKHHSNNQNQAMDSVES